ncbi:nuclear receptor coactivator 3 [Culicoides brevitarsis]|uniref:nuclear receptor coactivator 3 n=1 Tax=Culicoides brevitarsis TaxID=469753 RepID=UPI00307B2B0D
MSIATAENAGLVPCDLPIQNQWINNNNNNSNTTNNNTASFAHQTSSLAGLLPGVVGGSALGGNSLLSPLSHPQAQASNQQQMMQQVKAAQQKIRRKTDNKPQSQINKCNNEKRRRELENEYIEQLGEFLQINKRDMTQTKPDKAHILSEVVKTFRKMLEDGKVKRSQCHPDCTDQCTVHPVQQGEVSSTEPETFMNGNSPEKSAYFEAVRHYISNIGWVLLEINDRRIEYATENVCEVLHYTRTELQGQDIYTFLSPGDHAHVGSILSKDTVSVAWGQDQDSNNKVAKPARCRWLIKQNGSVNNTPKYKDVLISSAPLKDDAEGSSSMLCLITMPEDDTTEMSLGDAGVDKMGFSSTQLVPTGEREPFPEQFTLKLDTNGKILQISTASLTPENAIYFKNECLIGASLQDLCHAQDRHRILKFLQEAKQMTKGEVPLESYRIQVGLDQYMHVKCHARVFSSPATEPYIMAMHSILGDNDKELDDFTSSMMQSMPGTSQMTAQSMSQSTNSSMGGPLMTSVVNGNMNQSVLDRLTNQMSHQFSQDAVPGDSSWEYPDVLDLPHSTFDLDSSWDPRPDSRLSATSNTGTPRPPSVSAYSPATCPSPLTSFSLSGMNSQPSPSNNNNNNSNISNNNFNSPGMNAGTGNGGYGGNTPNYEKPDEKPNLEKLQAGLNDAKLTSPNNHAEQPKQNFESSDRLRNLLTSKSSASSSSDGKNVILKNLLKSDEDPPGKCHLPPRHPGSHNMLQQLLNEKSSDDDDMDGKHKNSELLKHLNKKESPLKCNEDIMQKLKYQGNDRKRPATGNGDDSAAKRETPKESLQEKNKMLASLLAGPPKAPVESALSQNPVRMIPDIPKNNGISGKISSTTSQMSPITSTSSLMNNNNNIDKMSGNAATAGRQLLRKPSSDNYLNTMQPNNNAISAQQNNIQQKELLRQLQSPQPQLPQRLQQQQQTQQQQPNFPNPHSTNPQAGSPYSGNVQNEDPYLQSILNEFLDYASSNETDADLDSLLGMSSSQQYQQEVEKRAINAIQVSLMECETNAFSGSPPAYPLHSTMAASQQPQQQMGNFPPPPNYPNQPNQRRISMSQVTTAGAANPGIARLINQQQQMHQQRKQINMEKERLLRLQQQQKIVGQTNATTSGAETICNSQGMQNIESSIPPNVSLQRTPDSQMSPGFNIIQQQLSPNQQRPPFSPQAYSATNQFNLNPLSPQHQLQQMQHNYQANQFQQGANSPAQLSPMSRQFGPGTPTGQQPPPQWSQALAARGMNAAAQGNPMLSGQLGSPNNFNGGRPIFQGQRQRSLNSPGARSASFQDGFPGPPSPSQAAQGYQQPGMFPNVPQQLQQRLQRQQSAPQPMTGSPRPYGGQDQSPFGMMYNNSPNLPPQHSAGGPVATNNSPNDYFTNRTQSGEPTGDFIRQGLRAVVTGRTQSGIRTPQSPVSVLSANSPSAPSPAQPQLPNTAPLMNNSTTGTGNNVGPNDMGFNFDQIAQADFYGGSTPR